MPGLFNWVKYWEKNTRCEILGVQELPFREGDQPWTATNQYTLHKNLNRIFQ